MLRHHEAPSERCCAANKLRRDTAFAGRVFPRCELLPLLVHNQLAAETRHPVGFRRWCIRPAEEFHDLEIGVPGEPAQGRLASGPLRPRTRSWSGKWFPARSNRVNNDVESWQV